jgi:hypothetical protein
MCTRLDLGLLVNVVWRSGMKADNPEGPEAVTRAMITAHELRCTLSSSIWDLRQSPQSGCSNVICLNVSADETVLPSVQKLPKHLFSSSVHLLLA